MVRLKHRYILVNILYPEAKSSHDQRSNGSATVPFAVQLHQPIPDAMDAKLFTKMIRQGVSDLFGDYGSGMIAGSLQVKYFSPATSTAIIRVSRDHYRLVWAALTFTTRLLKPVDQACVMQVVRVSGTIKKAEEEAIRRARLSIKQAQLANGRSHVLSTAIPVSRGPLTVPPDHALGIEDPNDPSDEDDEDDDDDD